MQRKSVPPEEDPKTREASERHRTHPDPPVQGQQTGRQLLDTDGEGGVGGSLDGLYWKDDGKKGPAGNGPGSPRRNPTEDGDLDYGRAHAELGDASADFTGERAEMARQTVQGEPEVTESLTSSGVMAENLDLGAETEGDGSPFVEGSIDRPAPRRTASENRKDRRKPADSAIQKP